MPETALTAFAAAATGFSAGPPTTFELNQFTTRFVNEYSNDGHGLGWPPSRIKKRVGKFHKKFPNGSWVLFWQFLAWEISDIADRKIARRAVADLQTFITYADPTGNTAVRNVMRTLTS